MVPPRKLHRRKTFLPESYVLSDNDVVCGRGRTCFHHKGNARFRELVKKQLERYTDAKAKNDKTSIICEIVDYIRKSSPTVGAGFVKRDKTSGRYYEVGDFAAREKTSQAFRDLLQEKYKSSNANKRSQRKATATRGNPSKGGGRIPVSPTHDHFEIDKSHSYEKDWSISPVTINVLPGPEQVKRDQLTSFPTNHSVTALSHHRFESDITIPEIQNYSSSTANPSDVGNFYQNEQNIESYDKYDAVLGCGTKATWQPSWWDQNYNGSIQSHVYQNNYNSNQNDFIEPNYHHRSAIYPNDRQHYFPNGSYYCPPTSWPTQNRARHWDSSYMTQYDSCTSLPQIPSDNATNDGNNYQPHYSQRTSQEYRATNDPLRRDYYYNWT